MEEHASSGFYGHLRGMLATQTRCTLISANTYLKCTLPGYARIILNVHSMKFRRV